MQHHRYITNVNFPSRYQFMTESHLKTSYEFLNPNKTQRENIVVLVLKSIEREILGKFMLFCSGFFIILVR